MASGAGDSFQQYSKQTVIVEYTRQGKGLASFLSFLFNWAKEIDQYENFKKAFEITILTEEFNPLKTIVIPEENLYVDCKVQQVPTSLIVPLARSEDYLEISDRLVPHYPHLKWGHPPLPTNNIKHIAKLEQKLKTVILKKLGYPLEHQIEKDLETNPEFRLLNTNTLIEIEELPSSQEQNFMEIDDVNIAGQSLF